MRGKPLISIITITYNSKTFLEGAIQSILAQNYSNIEYIIVDGVSTDDTLEIIKKYAERDSRIRWSSEPDEGISDAFNKGLECAKGDIVGILNSDDMYVEGTLEAIAEASNNHPDCDVFHGDIVKFQGDVPLFCVTPTDIKKNIWHEMPINHPTTFVTKRAYDRVGNFKTELKVAMDYDLVLRLYINDFKFFYIDKVLAKMRYGGASDEKFLDGLREVLVSSVNNGYPIYKAYCWFAYKATKGFIKNILRKLRLHFLIRLHPNFHSIKKGESSH